MPLRQFGPFASHFSICIGVVVALSVAIESFGPALTNHNRPTIQKVVLCSFEATISLERKQLDDVK